MTENAIDSMKVNEKLEQKNREVEELQKEKEEQARQIESLIEENEKLVGVLRKKETESVLAQNEVKKFEREIAECRARQERASRNIKTDVEEIKAQIIKQLCQLKVEADSLVEMEEGRELGRTAESSTQTENEAKEVEELEGNEENTSVLILGGHEFLDTIYLLDSKAQSWKKLSITLPMGMHSFGAVVLNEEIYIFGGSSEDAYLQDCYKLKVDRSWIELASLNQERASISSSSLVYKGNIWVIGGYSGNLFLNSVEKYDISQDKWTYMPQMNYPRSDVAVAVFKDRIFVTGGYNEKCLKSVEMFDPKLQKWILFCDLPLEVGGHTMLINNSTLSMFGGISESGPLNSVWEMNIEDPEKKWTEKPSFKHLRCIFGIGKLSNKIIVFGDRGDNGNTSEIFDGNDWIDGPKLPQDLLAFAYTSIPRSLEESFLKNAVRTENKVEKQSGGQQNTSVLILGGHEFLDTIYLLDSKTQSWKELSITLPVEMRGFGAVVLNDEIYIFGGYSCFNNYHQHCYKLKDDGSWMELASLNRKRAHIPSSSLVYKGYIWAIGGHSGNFSLKSVEKYDISQDEWTYMPEMNYARCLAAAAVFKNRIFVTGGRNEIFLKSVEMFDPIVQKWLLICDLPIEVFGHTMLINNSTLSIFGGYSGSHVFDSVWEMDFKNPEKKWIEKQNFKHLRACFGVGKLSNGIIVFGHGDNNGETSEIFDGNGWIDGPKLPQRLSHFAYISIPEFLEERLLEQFS